MCTYSSNPWDSSDGIRLKYLMNVIKEKSIYEQKDNVKFRADCFPKFPGKIKKLEYVSVSLYVI